MLTKEILFKNFKLRKKNSIILKKLSSLIKENNQIINSLGLNYKDSYKKNSLRKYKKCPSFRVIGMGGSSLGAQAIYDFLKFKIKKNFSFVDNLKPFQKKAKAKKFVNLIVSKSGNTIETIANLNVLIKKKDYNIFITENKNNYLHNCQIIHHNNFIGEIFSFIRGGMLLELMGLKSSFYSLSLIKNKKFLTNWFQIYRQYI